MKNSILKKIFFSLIVIMGLSSCDDREIITIDKKDPSIVMDLSTKTLVLDQNFPNNPALTVAWSATNFTVPVSIKYKIEVSKTQDFAKTYPMEVPEGGRVATYTTAQVNAAATSINLDPFVPSKMYIRVSSYLGDGYLQSYSNLTYITVTPYKLSYPTFYIVGDASYVGWTATAAQDLYKSDNISVIYTYLEKNKNFRFLGQKDWNPANYSLDDSGIKDNYRYFKQWSSSLAPETKEKENIIFSGETGIYKIAINASPEKKSIEVTPSPIPGFDIAQVYLVGNVAGNGWSAENAVAMTKSGAGIFEFTTTLPADAEFKFLGQKSFGDLDWGNIQGAGNTGFLGPKGDNGNIKFVGDGGTYKITVNIKAGIYKVVKQ